MPKALKIDVRRAASREWIEASVRFAANELAEGRIASSSVIARLSESLLTEAVRQYASTLAEEEVGWLKGVKDPHIGRALALIHHQLGAPWSAERLAREVALSRSAFVERFSSLVGMPPIRYLTFWRLQSAKLNLRETRKTIAQLAYSVGYESEEGVQPGVQARIWSVPRPVERNACVGVTNGLLRGHGGRGRGPPRRSRTAAMPVTNMGWRTPRTGLAQSSAAT